MITWPNETDDRLDRVTRERCISNANWYVAAHRLDQLGCIAHTARHCDMAVQPDRNHMPISWYWERIRKALDWPKAFLYCVALPLCWYGLVMLAWAIYEVVSE